MAVLGAASPTVRFIDQDGAKQRVIAWTGWWCHIIIARPGEIRRYHSEALTPGSSKGRWGAITDQQIKPVAEKHGFISWAATTRRC